MMKNGDRPRSGQIRQPLREIAEQLDQSEGVLSAQTQTMDLLSDLVAAPLDTTARTTAQGTLMQLGGAFLLPMDSGEIRRPTEIRMSTNGVLGNHLEVRYSAGAYSFIGRDRHQLSNLVDGNALTWAEVEGYTIDQTAVRRTRGYGFETNEGLSWLLPPGELLNWKLDLTVPKDTYSYLYVGASTSSPFPMVDRIAAGTDALRFHTPLRESLLTPLSGQIDQLTLELSQSNSYPTMIGHAYRFEPLNPAGEVTSDLDIRRVPGPFLSLESVGVRVTPDRRIHWPSLTDQPDGMPEHPGSSVETLAAHRHAIALTDVALLTGTFAAEGETILGPFSWPSRPSRIRLDANISLPVSWTAGNWIDLAVSSDQADWYAISPDGIGAPREYAIGSIPVQEELPVLVASGQDFWLRVRLRRPDTDQRHTPVISDVRLVGEV